MRNRFSEEQIIKILNEGEAGQVIREVCRAHGISEQTYFRWRKKYGGMGITEARKLRQLEKENARLKRMLAERDLEIDIAKEALAKNF